MKKIIFTVFFVMTQYWVNAQTEEKAIIDKYFEAIGRDKAVNKIKAYILKSEMNIDGKKAQLTHTVIMGESARSSAKFDDFFLDVVWSKGKGWQNSSFSSGVEDMQESFLEDQIQLTKFGNFDPNLPGYRIQYIGIKSKNNVSYKVLSVEKEFKQFFYFDEQGLLRIIESVGEEGSKNRYFNDYKNVGYGYKVPFTDIIVTVDESEENRTVETIKEFLVNPPIDNKIFTKPI